jgi:hypothetical protein
MNTRRLTKRPLNIPDVLRWADAHRELTGRWPTKDGGDIPGTHGETWLRVDAALRAGTRDLPGGISLSNLLVAERGARNIHALPPLSEEQILKWADAHRQRTGSWPTFKSGTILDSAGDKWMHIHIALQQGGRHLPGGSSLPKLLAEHRGVRNRKDLPHYTVEQILAWADAHRARTGAWPSAASGAIADAPGETWGAVQNALRGGRRGIPGGSSLAQLLAEKRGARNFWSLPDLSCAQILKWADAFHQRTGTWPIAESGSILEAPGETWCAVDQALKHGSRQLPGRLSLARLLDRERGVRNHANPPRLSRKLILAWADAHRRRTGTWPTRQSGPIVEAVGETWQTVDAALCRQSRGLRGASSLPQLLAKYRGRRTLRYRPNLSRKKIVAWADAHFQRTGQWPNTNSGPVHGVPGERWKLIDNALRAGTRGLKGGSSLLRLLVRKRGVRNPLQPPRLTCEQILAWALVHKERTGHWPTDSSGPVIDAPEESWAALDFALRHNKRGLPPGMSLPRLLAEYR